MEHRRALFIAAFQTNFRTALDNIAIIVGISNFVQMFTSSPTYLVCCWKFTVNSNCIVQYAPFTMCYDVSVDICIYTHAQICMYVWTTNKSPITRSSCFVYISFVRSFVSSLGRFVSVSPSYFIQCSLTAVRLKIYELCTHSQLLCVAVERNTRFVLTAHGIHNRVDFIQNKSNHFFNVKIRTRIVIR